MGAATGMEGFGIEESADFVERATMLAEGSPVDQCRS